MDFRPGASNGVWLAFLLPLSIWAASSSTEETLSDVRTLMFYFSVFLSGSSLLVGYRYLFKKLGSNFSWSEVVKHASWKIVHDLFERRASAEVRIRRTSRMETFRVARQSSDRIHDKDIAFSIFFFMILFVIGPSKTTNLLTLVYSYALMITFPLVLQLVFKHYPKSFSFGEGCLVVQALFVYFFSVPLTFFYDTDDATTSSGSFGIIAKAGLNSCLVLCGFSFIPGIRWISHPNAFFVAGSAILIGGTIPFLFLVLHRNPVSWILDHIFQDSSRSALLGSWVVCVFVAVTFVSRNKGPATTETRKVFHLLVVIVFTLGILVDVDLLYLATVAALSLFILIEHIRTRNIEPFSGWINSAFKEFLDEKDQGSLILTNIYLLVGCSLPLWLCPDLNQQVKTNALPLFAGILSIGIGDSAASIGGTRFGRTKWPDSPKSIEGTLFSIISQLTFVSLLEKGLGFAISSNMWIVVAQISIVAIMEALTNQVDNLVLPLVMFALTSKT